MSLQIVKSDSLARRRARAVIEAMLGYSPPDSFRLAEDNAGLDALIALERVFTVDLDVDEVYGADIPMILDLIEERAKPLSRHHDPMIWDAERGVYLFPAPAFAGRAEDETPAILRRGPLTPDARQRRRVRVTVIGWYTILVVALVVAVAVACSR